LLIDLGGEFRLVGEERSGTEEDEGAEDAIDSYREGRQERLPQGIQCKERDEQREDSPPSPIDDADSAKGHDCEDREREIKTVGEEVTNRCAFHPIAGDKVVVEYYRADG